MVEPLARVEDQVAKIADRLASEYADRLPAGIVHKLVDDAYSPLRFARVTQFVPVLIDRSVRQQLRTGSTAP